MQNSYKRVDAHLSSLGYCSRSEAKKFLNKVLVCINGVRVFDSTKKAYHNDITVENEVLDAESLIILMNKPSGVVCSHEEENGVLIYSLLPERFQKRSIKISTVGRLDKDTTGAILLTDDGALNHKLTSPKSDVSKIYEATLAKPLRGDEAELFLSGTLILHGEKKPLLSAKMEIITPTLVRLEICEGRYHQVKRMFGAVSNKVVQLHRLNFGDFSVEDLEPSHYKIINL